MVKTYSLTEDTDRRTDKELQAWTAAVLPSFEAGGVVFASRIPTTTKIAAGRAFVEQARGSRYFPFDSQYTFIYRGRIQIVVNCQLVDQRDLLRRGCSTVLDTLQIAEPARPA